MTFALKPVSTLLVLAALNAPHAPHKIPTAPSDAEVNMSMSTVTQPSTDLEFPKWIRDATNGWSPRADGEVRTAEAASDLAWVMIDSQNKVHTTRAQWQKSFTADLEGDVWVVHQRLMPHPPLGAGPMVFISRKDGRLLGVYVDQ